VTELASPWRARLAVGLVRRYEARDLTKLSDRELNKLYRRLDRIVGDEAEPFEPEEVAELYPLLSSGPVEHLHFCVSAELGRRLLRRNTPRWVRRPSELRRRLIGLPPLTQARRPRGRARRLVVRVTRRRRLAGDRPRPSADDDPDPVAPRRREAVEA
jgi:hypothetical protein